MRSIEELKILIEEARKELDALILTEKLDVYYEKSKELDKLIEEYLELDDFEEDFEEEFVEA